MDAELVWKFGELLEWCLSPLDNIGNSFNYAVIVLGFIGFFIWMAKQSKFNKEAESNSDQIK